MSSRPTRNNAIVFRGTEKLVVEDIGYPKFEDPMGRQQPASTPHSHASPMRATERPDRIDGVVRRRPLAHTCTPPP